MTTIQWYPGHMTKARREMQAQIKQIDLIIEVLDARAPKATRNPDLQQMIGQKPRVVVLNKMDLADEEPTRAWVSQLEAEHGQAMAFCAVRKGERTQLIKRLQRAAAPVARRWKERGMNKTMRILVAGIPNVGKSSIINTLSNAGRAKTGARPGVTRGRQWVHLDENMELMDTPGILWPRFDDQVLAMHLTYINAIRDEILDDENIAHHLAAELLALAPQGLARRYGIDPTAADAQSVLVALAQKRGFLLRGGQYDGEKAARALIEDYRSGRLGRITLEQPEVYPL